MKTNMIPVTIVDDFFECPDLWIDLASKCQFTRDKIGKWPGERSAPLHEIYPEAHEMLCRKFFSLFYDLSKEKIGFKVEAYFQKIPSKYDEGWVHFDEKLISGIVYLSQNPDINAGTSLYRPNSICKIINVKDKLDEYSDVKSSEDVILAKEQNNRRFTELVKVQNVFNRLISFDCNIAHCAHFGSKEFERLTLVFFVERLDVEKTPIARMRANV